MSKTHIRSPKQDRSRAKAEAVLAAAADIIEDKGVAALKVQDIASKAGVTLSSIYQYYKNKDAVVLALADLYYAEIQEMMVKTLGQTPKTREDAIEVTQALLKAYLELGQTRPVMRQVFAAIRTDKSLVARDLEDSRDNTELLFNICKGCFSADSQPDLKRRIALLVHLSGSVLDLLPHQTKAQQQETIDTALAIFRSAIQDVA